MGHSTTLVIQTLAVIHRLRAVVGGRLLAQRSAPLGKEGRW